MKLASKRAVVTITLELEQDEAIQIAQLANQVAGDSPRSLFYQQFARGVSEELAKHNVDVPPAAKDFAVSKGKFFTLPLPKSAAATSEEDPEPKLGVAPKFV